MILAATTVQPLNDNLDLFVAKRTNATGVTVVLTGADGSTWDLTHGPVRLQPGVVGLKPADVEHLLSTAPGVPGAQHHGVKEAPATMRLRVFLTATAALPMRDLEGALWDALNPDADCQITVITPDALARTRTVRFVGVDDDPTDRDPLIILNASHPLVFVAPDPYWVGPAVSYLFKPDTPAPFLAPPAAGSTTVFNFTAASATTSAAVDNPGDVPTWLSYAITGPTGFTVGVADSTVVGSVGTDTTMFVDTHPARQTIGYAVGDNDEDAWLQITARDFAAIPRGTDVPITIGLTNAGAGAAVQVTLAPRYRRPL